MYVKSTERASPSTDLRSHLLHLSFEMIPPVAHEVCKSDVFL